MMETEITAVVLDGVTLVKALQNAVAYLERVNVDRVWDITVEKPRSSDDDWIVTVYENRPK